MASDILHRICQGDSLPGRPTVALEVLRLIRAKDFRVDDLVRVIQTEPSLTARILRIVNSSLYGVATKVVSIKQAVVALGQRTVQVIAISLSLVDSVRTTQNKRDSFDYPRYWRRSLSTAVAARLLALRIEPDLADETFIGGLLADLGMVAAWYSAPELYEPVLKLTIGSGRPIEQAEYELLGLTHATMSEALLQGWGLPEQLCKVVGAHNQYGSTALTSPTARIARIVRHAEQISIVLCHDVPNEQLITIREEIVAELEIAPLELEYLLEEIDPIVRETASMYSVRVADAVDYNEISADAVLRLAELSAESERERGDLLQRERQAHREVDRLTRVNSVIQAAARVDGLTKVANRAAFDRQLELELQRARQRRYSLGLIMLDIDYFKQFNDRYGHQAGDEVLRELAGCLREITNRIGYVARYGGEEFAIIVTQQNADQIRGLAEEIRETVQTHPVRHDKEELHATVSLGAACLSPEENQLSESELIEIADRSLYQAKRAGRNRVVMAHDTPPPPNTPGWRNALRKLFGG